MAQVSLQPHSGAAIRPRYWWLPALLGLLLLAGCRHTPAEQQIREQIASAAAAARANDASAVLAVVSKDFSGDDGLDRQGLRRLLALRALRQDRTGVLPGPVSFERKGDRVLAKFNLVLTGGRPGTLLPEESAIYRMTTAWRQEGREWKCYHAAWSR